jgi:hypothetical protein
LYKPVFNENMITFTNWTKLEEVVEVPPAFPVLTYSLTPIDQLHLCVDNREYYTCRLSYLYATKFKRL